jgi:threonine/homoserine/homoserine lactone efflux protein
MKEDLVNTYTRLFKQNKEFNLIIFGAMLGISIYTIFLSLLLSFSNKNKLMSFLSFMIFGSILIGYFAYKQAKKL